MIQSIDELFNEIEHHFLSKLEYPIIFAQEKCEVEGWFKGELLHLFTRLRKESVLPDWKSEVMMPGVGKDGKNGTIDFRVIINDSPNYLEMKTLKSKNLGSYFRNDYVYGLINDVHKLANIGQGFCLLFVYPSPLPGLWEERLKNYAQITGNLGPRAKVEDERKPPEEQSPLYIARLKVSRAS